MKICWDNLEKIRINKYGEFITLYHVKLEYKEKCKCCGEPYLMDSRSPTDFCSHSCHASGSNNPMAGRKGIDNPNTGRKFSYESRKKMSESAKKRKHSEKTKLKISLLSFGRKHTEDSIEKMRQSKLGKKHSKESIEKMKKSAAKGPASPFWKGGIRKNKIALHDTYVHRLDFAEETKHCFNEDDLKILLVRCAYCNRWFNPTTVATEHRIAVLEGRSSGEKRFYCSIGCKNSCPTYNQIKYPKGFKKATSREVDPYTRKLCFERDGWECQKCGSEKNLHCHHIKSYGLNKVIANDIDNCITLCKDCHKKIHKMDGCKYNELRCKEE